MPDQSIKALFNKVDLLIHRCEELQQRNLQLTKREKQWQQERAQLVGKNELARSRIETMISQLKSLQSNAEL